MTWNDERQEEWFDHEQDSIGNELALRDYVPERDDFEDETDTPDDYEEVQTP